MAQAIGGRCCLPSRVAEMMKSKGIECISEPGTCAFILKGTLSAAWGWALLDANSKGFVMKARRLSQLSVMVGVAPADLDASGANQYNTTGYSLYFRNLRAYGRGSISNRDVGLPDRELGLNEVLHLRYSRGPPPALSASLDGVTFKALPIELSPGDYRPFVSLHTMSDVSVQIDAPISATLPHAATCRKTMNERLWRDRLFTDCTVTCGASEFRCHRAILANASDVWRTAFEGSFIEGRDARLSIDDAEPLVVEALLKYAYTCEFDFDDAAAALPLAHRYEISSLVTTCARQLLENVTVDNVARIASTLNAYLEHEGVAKVWPRLLDIIGSDQDLLDAAMRRVKV
uniref:BTB domain-containing protein n=1 Tax=Pyrodinium bahamense TaxID=73915 RepID=A0A7S0FPG3_9DINO